MDGERNAIKLNKAEVQGLATLIQARESAVLQVNQAQAALDAALASVVESRGGDPREPWDLRTDKWEIVPVAPEDGGEAPEGADKGPGEAQDGPGDGDGPA